jgi:hypothetical protein
MSAQLPLGNPQTKSTAKIPASRMFRVQISSELIRTNQGRPIAMAVTCTTKQIDQGRTNLAKLETNMKSTVIKFAIAGILIALSSCTSIPGSAGSGFASVGYDTYYDDAYGPFYDGYWGDDGGFYYRGGAGRPFIRDGGSHFRHAAAGGFHGVRASGGRR